MMSQKPDHQVDQNHDQTRGITSHGVVPTRSSSSSSVTPPFTQDSPKGGLFIISEGSQQEQKEYWDLKTAAFSSPYYDPFAEGEEKKVEIVSPVDRQDAQRGGQGGDRGGRSTDDPNNRTTGPGLGTAGFGNSTTDIGNGTSTSYRTGAANDAVSQEQLTRVPLSWDLGKRQGQVRGSNTGDEGTVECRPDPTGGCFDFSRF